MFSTPSLKELTLAQGLESFEISLIVSIRDLLFRSQSLPCFAGFTFLLFRRSGYHQPVAFAGCNFSLQDVPVPFALKTSRTTTMVKRLQCSPPFPVRNLASRAI